MALRPIADTFAAGDDFSVYECDDFPDFTREFQRVAIEGGPDAVGEHGPDGNHNVFRIPREAVVLDFVGPATYTPVHAVGGITVTRNGAGSLRVKLGTPADSSACWFVRGIALCPEPCIVTEDGSGYAKDDQYTDVLIRKINGTAFDADVLLLVYVKPVAVL